MSRAQVAWVAGVTVLRNPGIGARTRDRPRPRPRSCAGVTEYRNPCHPDYPGARVFFELARSCSLRRARERCILESQSTPLKAIPDRPITRNPRRLMRAIPPTWLMKVIVGASLTLLAMSLIAPESTEAASCDHPSDRPSIGLDAIRLDGPPTTEPRAPRPKPCNGPSCTNRSAPSPTSTSAPQPPPRSELWGLIVDPSPVDPPGSSARTLDGDLEWPVRLARPIFHPPRLPR
jgi:hypothetical protein